MKSASETHILASGATVEVGTITHEGRTFKAGGSCIDMERGRIFAYVKQVGFHKNPALASYELTSWGGDPIMPLQLTGTATGFHGSKLYCFSGTLNGRKWSGRGQGAGMYLTMRAGRAV